MTDNNTSHDSDYFDFGKLEKEIQNSVVSEERYWRENDAKIRAVEQRVPSYDDFREMVLAAHLKPLETKDKISSIGTFTQVWNQSAQRYSKPPGTEKKMSNSEKDKMQNDFVAKLPKTGQEFVLHWRRYCKTREDKKLLLLAIGGKRAAEIFRIEIGELLGEFLECLQYLEDSETAEVMELLLALAKSQRFSLSLAFLCRKEKESCKNLFEKLKVSSHAKGSDLVQESVTMLESIYCKEKWGRCGVRVPGNRRSRKVTSLCQYSFKRLRMSTNEMKRWPERRVTPTEDSFAGSLYPRICSDFLSC